MPSSLIQASCRNRLLAALSAEDFALLAPGLEPVDLPLRTVVEKPNEPDEYAYFIEDGLASVIAAAGSDDKIEVGVIGREGLTGVPVILGTDFSPHESMMQIAGRGLRIRPERFREAIETSPFLHGLMMRYVQTQLIQVSQTALANGRYTVEERLARWLLMAQDRVERDELALTHEFLATMLGVRRPGVTVALHLLEGARIIRSTRGKVTILDRGRLEETAGASYGIPETEYRRLILNERAGLERRVAQFGAGRRIGTA